MYNTRRAFMRKYRALAVVFFASATLEDCADTKQPTISALAAQGENTADGVAGSDVYLVTHDIETSRTGSGAERGDTVGGEEISSCESMKLGWSTVGGTIGVPVATVRT